MKQAMDQKLSRYRNNPLVKALADAAKKEFEKRLREEARKG